MRHSIPTMMAVIGLLIGLSACSGAPLPFQTPIPTLAPTPKTQLVLATGSAQTTPPPSTEEEWPELPGYVGGAVLNAVEAAQAADWEEVEEELNEAIDLSTDVRHKALFSTILRNLSDGKTDEVLAELEGLAHAVTTESPLLGELETALQFARIEDWEEVQEEVNEALELSTDARLQAALGEMLADLDNGRHSEVLRDLERLVGGAGDTDPALAKLHKAMEYAQREEWEMVRRLLDEALDRSGDAQHQAAIAEMVADLKRGNYDEVRADLAALLGPHEETGPVLTELRAALTYAVGDNWTQVDEKLREAHDLSTDPQQQAAIAALLDDLSQGRNDEVIGGLEKMLHR